MKILLIFFYLLPVLLYGQSNTSWTLQDCIDTALINNSKIRIANLNLAISGVNANSSKFNFLPSVNGNASHGYNFGQTIDPFTNQFATDRVQYNNFYLSSSLTLFSGLTNHYTKKITGIDQNISALNLQIEKRNISIDIIGAYLQAKLNEEIVFLKEKRLTYSKAQTIKAKLRESLNYDTKQKRLQIEAQSSKDAYELVLAKNDLLKSLNLLQTIVGLAPSSDFNLSDSLVFKGEFSVDEKLANELELEKKIIESQQLKGQLSPSLSLNGSLGSGYSENNKFLSPSGDFAPKPFDVQLGENFYQSISASLTIPIFNGVNSYSRIKVNQLEYEQVKIQSTENIRQRENQLLRYQMDVTNNKEAVLAAEVAYEAYKLLFSEAEIQLENNAISYYGYLEIKDQFFIAQSELVQSKYRLKFSQLILHSF
ncbi:MAG: TolC family protein [Crocinitomicaceae bacterium]